MSAYQRRALSTACYILTGQDRKRDPGRADEQGEGCRVGRVCSLGIEYFTWRAQGSRFHPWRCKAN